MPRRRRPVPVSLPLPAGEQVRLSDAVAVLSDLDAAWEGAILDLDVDRRELRVLAYSRKPAVQHTLQLDPTDLAARLVDTQVGDE